MKPPVFAASAAIFSLLVLSQHSALADCTGKSYVPVPGSAGATVANQAFKGFSRLYGATAVAEREVLPLLRQRTSDHDDSAGVVHLQSNSIFGAGQQLLVAESNESGCPNFVRSDYDLYSGSFGLGLRMKWFSAFYVTSVVGGQPEANTLGRVFNPIASLAVINVYSVIAPAVGSWNVNEKGVSISGDYIAGGQVDILGTNIAVGYIGSSGLYSNITQEKLRLFASAAIAREFSELAYLTAGIDRIRAIREMLTTAYARKVVFSPPPQFSAGSFVTPTTQGIDFWTGHLEQLDIAKLVDIKAALAVQPNVFLHDLRLGFHTGEYHVDPNGKRPGRDGGGASIEVGTVKIPENQAIGQPGKQLFSAKGIIKMFPKTGLAGDLGLSLAFNDPEVITRFPAAHNVFSLNFGGTFRVQ